MRGLSVLAVVVAIVAVGVPARFIVVVTFVVGVDIVVVFAGVLHPWLVRGAVSGAASVGTTTSVAGCAEVVEDCGRASAPYLAHQMSESDSH